MNKMYWQIAKGLQDVDHLKISKKLVELINENIEGNKSYFEIENELKEYYKNNNFDREFEADLVTVRIASLLTNNDFSFSKQELLNTHEYLFKDVFNDDKQLRDTQGKFRKVNISKPEAILNNKTVIYSHYENIDDYLDYDFNEENNRTGIEKIENIEHLCKFVSNIWNIHPFREGNTRTIAVFIIRYLLANNIVLISNPFSENSLYFRNALVLASDNESESPATLKYLESFFYKLLVDNNAELLKMEKVL